MQKLTSHSLKDTRKIAKDFSKSLRPGVVVALFGDLGSGKTTFAQCLAESLGVEGVVNSPTFTIVKEYDLKNDRKINRLYHLDLYRLDLTREVKEIGLKDMLKDKTGIIFIEWPEKAISLLPKNFHNLTFTYIDETSREIIIK